MPEVVAKCDICQNAYEEGGDWVPYGSTNVRLPTYIVCEEVDEDDFEKAKKGGESRIEGNELPMGEDGNRRHMCIVP
jgi:hypothetical protein